MPHGCDATQAACCPASDCGWYFSAQRRVSAAFVIELEAGFQYPLKLEHALVALGLDALAFKASAKPFGAASTDSSRGDSAPRAGPQRSGQRLACSPTTASNLTLRLSGWNREKVRGTSDEVPRTRKLRGPEDPWARRLYGRRMNTDNLLITAFLLSWLRTADTTASDSVIRIRS